MDENELNLQNITTPISNFKKRRQLLPWWIIGFIWAFFLFAGAVPVVIVLGLLHYNFQMGLLGIGTNDPLSIAGLILVLLFAFKGTVSFGLWNEKQWGVKLAKIDAIISIAVCCLVMGYEILMPNLHVFSFRLEIFVIAPYYYKMRQIQYDWENFHDTILFNPEEAELK